MRTLVIPGTNIETSRFIFGTASLMRIPSREARRRLLDAAVDHGFLHFDTAPYYGFGFSERELAPVLKTHPHVKITTKVGLYPPGGESQPWLSVIFRKAAGKVLPFLARPNSCFDLRAASASLEGSLRRLGRDHLDLYLLHDPPFERVEVPAWLDWLESRQKEGKIGAFGLALTAELLEPFLDRGQRLASVVQIHDSLDRQQANVLRSYGRPLQITYGYVSSARLAGDMTPAPLLIERAMKRNAEGPIIVSTRRVDRLRQYAQATETSLD